MKMYHFNRSRYAKIMSFEAFERLDALVQEKQTFPPEAKIPTGRYFNGKTPANLLTAVLLYWMKQAGVMAYRNGSQGTARKLPDGTVMFVPGSKKAKGQGDILSIIAGRAVFWEIKIGKDRLSKDQKRFKAETEEAGGDYIIVKDFDSFISEFEQLNQE